ncbi:MAG TPA: hypothetical protein VG963_32880, partial [Polyangiaceae bacterium]|nr:hypothetical protein [Polyangiaceae bacterium]
RLGGTREGSGAPVLPRPWAASSGHALVAPLPRGQSPQASVPPRSPRALSAAARRATAANHHATVQAASESSSAHGELEAPQKAPLTPSQSAGLGLELPL